MSTKILVVDSEKDIRDTLTNILESEKYDVLTVASGEEALEILGDEDIGVMIAEVRLPDMDGIALIKEASQVSTGMDSILLTGQASIESAIEALRLEAHDYLLKPISSQDLLSSLSGALSRREQTKRKRLLLEQLETSIQQLKEIEGMTELSKPDRQAIELPKDVQVDLARRELWRGSDHVHLTPTEGKMLRIFIENWGRVMSHSEIAFLVQGYEVNEWEAPEVLRPLISRLRKKLAVFPGGKGWIRSVRGTGYVFDAEYLI
ncbi:MAG: response regulator transcription factor [Anaerolineales bacterium]|nr:response regulator transcription factor [Chloroflexota bacterium]MBL6982718.1 response regulator transcription factor [Anaerolineales bacterium]